MLLLDGSHLVGKGLSGDSGAARGFFSLFYQWSKDRCLEHGKGAGSCSLRIRHYGQPPMKMSVPKYDLDTSGDAMGGYGGSSHGNGPQDMTSLPQRMSHSGDMRNVYGSGRMSSRGGGLSYKPGNWKCESKGCGYHNFTSNISCRRCGASSRLKAREAEQKAPYRFDLHSCSCPNGPNTSFMSPTKHDQDSGKWHEARKDELGPMLASMRKIGKESKEARDSQTSTPERPGNNSPGQIPPSWGDRSKRGALHTILKTPHPMRAAADQSVDQILLEALGDGTISPEDETVSPYHHLAERSGGTELNALRASLENTKKELKDAQENIRSMLKKLGPDSLFQSAEIGDGSCTKATMEQLEGQQHQQQRGVKRLKHEKLGTIPENPRSTILGAAETTGRDPQLAGRPQPETAEGGTPASWTLDMWSPLANVFSPLVQLQEQRKKRGLFKRDATGDKSQLSSSEETPRSTSESIVSLIRKQSDCIKAPPSPTVLSPLSEPLRHLMRSLPASIVVLTTTDAYGTNTNAPNPTVITLPEAYRGMTLSSFTTLTMSPIPTVTFNIRSTDHQPSRTFEALIKSHHFFIHLLDSSPEGARIADLFTRGNSEGMFHRGEKEGLFRVKGQYITSKVSRANTGELFPDPGEKGMVITKLPALHGKGVTKILRCTLLRKYETELDDLQESEERNEEDAQSVIRVGDHFQVIARVKEILDVPVLEEMDMGRHGLTYADGKYRRVGEVIDLRHRSEAL